MKNLHSLSIMPELALGTTVSVLSLNTVIPMSCTKKHSAAFKGWILDILETLPLIVPLGVSMCWAQPNHLLQGLGRVLEEHTHARV